MEDRSRLSTLEAASREDLAAYRGGNLIHNRRLIKFYYDAIMQNAHVFKDKVCMDLNCGTAILSLFLAKAGAKHVFAVDPYAHFAHKIVKDNNLCDKVTVLQMEPMSIQELSGAHEKVDVIVTDWAYYNPFFCEKRVRDLIHCRDKWLNKPFGKLFPDDMQLYVTGFEDNRNLVDFFEIWNNLYDLSWNAMKELVVAEPKKNIHIDPRQYMTEKRRIHAFNFYTLRESDLCFKTETFRINKRGNAQYNFLNGINLYHEIKFTCCHMATMLSSSPRGSYGGLHYSFYIQDPIALEHITEFESFIKVDPVIGSKDSEVAVEIGVELNYIRPVSTRYFYKLSHGL